MSNYSKLFRRFYSQKTKWESVIGLEVHAQILSKTKLFSSSSTCFASSVNTNVSLFDCAIPGTLPVLNKKCVESGILTALALNCRINPISFFDRKHYFYSDLPAGYQITQQRAPLANDGELEFRVFTPEYKTPYHKTVRIKQLQLEQDSGKSLHDNGRSLIDLNRAGVPLMELVFEPDLNDGEEAAALIKELILILQKIETCSCKMEEGALRVDANVSINRPYEPLGVRTEIKNIGSVRGVANAISYEIKRQINVLESNGKILKETRGWDAIKKKTVPMRDKEEEQDYRYIPEPNLPPLQIAMGPIINGCVNVDELEKQLPELPEETRIRLQNTWSLTLDQSIILTNDNSLLGIFENTARQGEIDGKLLANLLINELLSSLHKTEKNIDELNVDGHYFIEIMDLLKEGRINRNTIKLIINETIAGDADRPIAIVRKKNWFQITDDDELTILCQTTLNENVQMMEQYKNGKMKVFKAFLGIISKKSNRKADMVKCNKILKQLLDN